MQRARGHGYFVAAAAITLALPVIGFGRTFIVPWSQGQIAAPAVLVVHAAVFFAWVALLLVQALLVRRRRLASHRRLGWLGAGLAALMVATGLAVALAATARAVAQDGEAAAGFLLRFLVDLGLFAGLAAIGLAARRRPEAHGRLMLLATMSLMAAASARVPLLVDYPISVMLVLVASLVVFDLAVLRRLHVATAWGGAVVIGVQLAWQPLSETRAWRAAALSILGALDLLPSAR